MPFIQFRLIDMVDILLVAFLMYQVYRMVKGTIAVNIILGLFAIVAFWLIIRAFKMDLSASILDNFVDVGVLAIIIVFQQEIRRFFLQFGSKYKLLYSEGYKLANEYIEPLVRSCENLAKSNTGAIIVITRQAILQDYISTGEKIKAVVSVRLIEGIFFKNSPLHDGAIIISNNRIEAAACILPVSQNPELPKHMGLRHRAAMGITETTDAVAIVVSEERGEISFFNKGQYQLAVSGSELERLLQDL